MSRGQRRENQDRERKLHLHLPAWCIIRRWPASALRLTNGPRRASQDSIHHGCRAMNITQTGTCAHKSAPMRAGLCVCTIMTSPKGKCIIHESEVWSFMLFG
ncbi:unnamed protein product [Tetraodon nigroviridis]|uniref:(spotted green pufferfish) hypothetical protein n=1 Tax=Tetraodon nigroviridis TaxID=99883 RepID=Q4SG77_TETNG|nr:unnamed protein product [Tetraodon nigroviridis]